MKALSFIGSAQCEIVDSIKIKLPACFADEAFNNSTVVYERCSYISRDGSEVVYFKIWPDSRIDGARHVTNKRLRLTRVTREGYLILSQDMLACREFGDFLYLVGMDDYIAVFLKKPDEATAFTDRLERKAAEWLSVFGCADDGRTG